MTQLTTKNSVGNWVAQHPQTSRLFEDLQIDYCCGGGKPLEQACLDRNLDPQQVVQELEQTLAKSTATDSVDWTEAPLAELCSHIVLTHHAYLRRELPRLTAVIDKVVNAHGKAHTELELVKNVFTALRLELEPHMFKEEQILFPAICQLEQAADRPSFPFGTVANPIRMMEHEHDDAGDALAQLRSLTHAYKVPAGACNTYRAMLSGLAELEADMHQHVHKENNILFPRALELEQVRA